MLSWRFWISCIQYLSCSFQARHTNMIVTASMSERMARHRFFFLLGTGIGVNIQLMFFKVYGIKEEPQHWSKALTITLYLQLSSQHKLTHHSSQGLAFSASLTTSAHTVRIAFVQIISTVCAAHPSDKLFWMMTTSCLFLVKSQRDQPLFHFIHCSNFLQTHFVTRKMNTGW